MKTKLKTIRKVQKKIGDIVEIPTSKGFAYVQYTHYHSDPPVFGSLVRILQGFYETRPSNEKLSQLIRLPHRFQTFCPVHHTVNLGFFELIGNFPVPEFAQKFPTFKSSNNLPKTDPLEKIWWLWDGKKSWKVGKLPIEEQNKYPYKKVCNDTALVKNIETGLSLGRELS